MMNLTQNQASRLIDVIDTRIRKLTRSMSMVETTWGTVAAADDIRRTVDVYLYGSATASESFRVLAGDMPEVGENVKVAMDKGRGDRWVMEPFKNVVSDSTGATAYDPYGAASTAYSDAASDLSAHEAAGDPHSVYLTSAEGNAAYQPLHAILTALAGLTGAADKLAYFTGATSMAVTTITSFARSLLDDTSASDARTTLGLGTAATSNTGDFDASGAATSAVAGHTGDTSDAHDASAISFVPAGSISATDVQAAIEEVASEAGGSPAASAVTFTPAGTISATDVQAAIEEVAAEAGAGHAAVTLAADADVLLGLSTQQLTLDSQAANRVFAGPTTGAGADPTFRALVAADVPDLSAVYQPFGVTTTYGTSFPGSPSSGDRCYRSDLGLWFRYNGTRWLSETLYREPLPNAVTGTQAGSFSTIFSFGRWTPWHTTFDLWLEDFYTTTFVATTNTGSAYWNLALKKYQSDYATTSTIVTYATSGDSANVGKTAKTAIGALLTPATYVILQVDCSKTGSPGNLSLPAAAISYRLVGP